MCCLLQTREALQHAQQAGCPIILALTKCDMPGADPERVKMQLLSAGLLLEEAGGNVMVGPALLFMSTVYFVIDV